MKQTHQRGGCIQFERYVSFISWSSMILLPANLLITILIPSTIAFHMTPTMPLPSSNFAFQNFCFKYKLLHTLERNGKVYRGQSLHHVPKSCNKFLRNFDEIRIPQYSLMTRYESRNTDGTDNSNNILNQTKKKKVSNTRGRKSSTRRKRGISGNNLHKEGSTNQRPSTNWEPNALQKWRIFGVEVHPDDLASDTTISAKRNTKQELNAVATSSGDSVKESTDLFRIENDVGLAYLSQAVVESLSSRLRININENSGDSILLPDEIKNIRVIRRSLDGRKKRRRNNDGSLDKTPGPRYTYVLDVEIKAADAKKLRFKHQPGRMEMLSTKDADIEGFHSIKSDDLSKYLEAQDFLNSCQPSSKEKPKVIVVGGGPAGLFCALTLAESGLCQPIVLERGQPVESRGKDIGALMHRRAMDTESNFAFGEGGAGTWSDGKLTTRIGRNSEAVRHVLRTFVRYGAPEKILVDGSPHLGTDNLVRLLRNMRMDLRQLGGDVRFGARMINLNLNKNLGHVTGVEVEYSGTTERNVGSISITSQMPGTRETLEADAVILATGHSARDVYETLHAQGVRLEPKGFATGFRVEHPQKVINKIQYGNEWGPSAVSGKKKTDNINMEYFSSSTDDSGVAMHEGTLPVSSYRLATDKAYDGKFYRGAYSFCMCPGGQIVPASTNPDEVCVNGMSFSKRDSLWANSALVVTVSLDDPILETYREEHGVLAGIAFQREMERRASIMGGGNLTVPVQRLTDFIKGKPSTSAPSSSYRLGVKPAACHEIYPPPMVAAFRDAIVNYFEKSMPGFLCEDALLHAVETRTSSPVRIARDPDSLEAIGIKGLFPSGEGAGYAGGIVSAAVDGLIVADAVLLHLVSRDSQECKEDEMSSQQRKRRKSIGFEY